MVFKSVLSPLKMQTRTLLCFKDGSGYTIGSTEGRVAIQYIDDSQSRRSILTALLQSDTHSPEFCRVEKNFSFKCHRKDRKEAMNKTKTEVYSVNALSCHPFGTYSTAGADGTIK